MRRTPSAAAAKVGDPDAEDVDGCAGGQGPRRGGHKEPQHRVEVHGAADVARHEESRGPRERRCGSGGEGRAAPATSEGEGEAGRPPRRTRARETTGRRWLGAASSAWFFCCCVCAMTTLPFHE